MDSRGRVGGLMSAAVAHAHALVRARILVPLDER